MAFQRYWWARCPGMSWYALVCLCEISCGGFSMSRTQPKALRSHVLPWVLFSVSFLKENRINIASRQGLNEPLLPKLQLQATACHTRTS